MYNLMGKNAFLFLFSQNQTPESFHQVQHASAIFHIFRPRTVTWRSSIGNEWMNKCLFNAKHKTETVKWSGKSRNERKTFVRTGKIFGIRIEGRKLNGMFNKLAASVNLRNNLWRNKNFNLDFQLSRFVFIYFPSVRATFLKQIFPRRVHKSIRGV